MQVRKHGQILMCVCFISYLECMYLKLFTETSSHIQKCLANFYITLEWLRIYNFGTVVNIRNKANLKLTCPCLHSRFMTTDYKTHT